MRFFSVRRVTTLVVALGILLDCWRACLGCREISIFSRVGSPEPFPYRMRTVQRSRARACCSASLEAWPEQWLQASLAWLVTA